MAQKLSACCCRCVSSPQLFMLSIPFVCSSRPGVRTSFLRVPPFLHSSLHAPDLLLARAAVEKCLITAWFRRAVSTNVIKVFYQR
jgi:hypothetical protein